MELAKPSEDQRKDFIRTLLDMDKDQIAEFIKSKGRDPKKIKPFVCLNIQGKGD